MRKPMKLESEFVPKLKEELYVLFPGCYILKLDSGQQQGIPDLLILFNDRWAILEVKRHRHASHKPNQEYFVETFNNMSFSAFIFPENKEEILDELQLAFGTRRQALFS